MCCEPGGAMVIEIADLHTMFEQFMNGIRILVIGNIENIDLVAASRVHPATQMDVALYADDQSRFAIRGWKCQAILMARNQAIGVAIENVEFTHHSCLRLR